MWQSKTLYFNSRPPTWMSKKGGQQFYNVFKMVMVEKVIAGENSWVDIFEAINCYNFLHKVLDFGDAIMSECAIPEINVFDNMFLILCSM